MFRHIHSWRSNYTDNHEEINRMTTKSRLTSFQIIKILTSLALPLAVAIFTLITTIQNRNIARQNREQDLIQNEDDQRQNVFVNYIDDISRYRDENIKDLTNNYDKLLYIRTKTLTSLRKLDNKRKTYVLLFLKESSLLIEDKHSLLEGADFNQIETDRKDCIFQNVAFRRARLINAAFYLTNFISCPMDNLSFQNSVISESKVKHSSLPNTNFRNVKLDYVKFINVNLTKASFDDNSMQMKYVLIEHSILSNGTFSFIEDIHIDLNPCNSLEQWSIQPLDALHIINCTFVATRPLVVLAHWIKRSLIDRSKLINAGQAEFFVEIKQQQYAITFLSLSVYCIGIEHGVFETKRFFK
ncbi:hypothetical protein I4U23_019808 [Adineta vaga]|nr:hypothetical protein I4U23_019808 [Adineta vaga]